MAPSARLRLRLLGAPAVDHGAGARVELPWQRPVALVCYLACQADWVSRGHLAALLRPDEPDEAAKGYLRRLLHRVGDLPCAPAVEIESRRVRWAGDCDVRELEAAREASDWRGVIDLCARPFLEGVGALGEPGLDDWVDEERTRLQARVRAALSAEVERQGGSGDRSGIPALLQRLVELDPLDEGAVQFALARAQGDAERSVALGAYATLSRRLALEMAIKPLPATEALARSLRERIDSAIVPEYRASATSSAARLQPGATDPSPFMGREAELADLFALLDDPRVRVITLLGMGGIGKTRLARRLADLRSARHANGVIAVDLRGAENERALLRSLADAVGVPTSEPDLAARLRSALASLDGLIILDNVEQLADQASTFAMLFAASTQAKWVLTSRTALGVAHEHRLVLGGLPSGVPGDAASELLAWHARRLGHLRGGHDPATLARLSARLEGSPLALELAANVLGALTPEALERALDDGLDLIASGAADREPGHRSLRSVFDSSWQLLDPVQQRALAALTVFQGFDREAAAKVAHVDASMLLALAGRSLVRRDDGGRFSLHRQIATFAAGSLEAAQRGSIERAHARHYLALVGDQAGLRPGCHPRAAIATLAADFDNIVLAWRNALRVLPRAQYEALIGAAIEPLFNFATVAGRLEEAAEIFAATLDSPLNIELAEHADRARCASLLAMGRQEAVAERIAALDQSARKRGRDLRAIAQLALMRAMLAGRRGDFAAAQGLVERALTTAERSGDGYLLVRARLNLAVTLWSRGDAASAEPVLLSILPDAERLGAQIFHARALRMLGIVRLEQGRHAEGRALMEKALAILNELGDRFEAAYSLRNLSHTAAISGDTVAALDYARRSLASWQSIGAESEIAEAHFALGFAHHVAGETVEAESEVVKALRQGQALRYAPLAARSLALLGRLIAAKDRAHGLALLTFAGMHPSFRASDRRILEQLVREIAPTAEELEHADRRVAGWQLDERVASELSTR